MRADQLAICQKYGSAFVEPSDQEIVGVALKTLNEIPLHGVRIMPTENTTGWYVWGGTYSEDPNFYQPICLSHLRDRCPIIMKYLGLEPEFRFMIDHAGFEDVWREAAANNS
jgi:hypothetical protein